MLQFEFNGHTSDEYGLIVTRIEENDTLVNRSLQLGEKNKYRPKENQFGTLYGDNYSFKMGVMRNPCRNKNVVPELKNGILRYDPTYTPYLDNGILKFSMNYTADIKNGIIIPNDSDYLTSNNIRIINAYKDGLGNDMNKNIVATISIFNSDKSLNTIKDMITDDNRTGFKIIYGNTQKDYTGMKIESISEEISNERSVINISLATDKTIAPTETTGTTTEKTKEETKEKTETASDK